MKHIPIPTEIKTLYKNKTIDDIVKARIVQEYFLQKTLPTQYIEEKAAMEAYIQTLITSLE